MRPWHAMLTRVVLLAAAMFVSACVVDPLPAESSCDFDVVVDTGLSFEAGCQLDPRFTNGPVQIIAWGEDRGSGQEVMVLQTIGQVEDVSGESVDLYSADGSAALLMFEREYATPRNILIETSEGNVSCTFELVLDTDDPGCVELE